MTSTLLDAPLMRIRIYGGNGRLSGLDRDSDVMIDKLFTVPRNRMRKRIGHLTPAQMGEITAELAVFLGM